MRSSTRRTFAFASLPIASGTLQGARWILPSGGKLLRVLRGTYEPQQTNAFTELVGADACVLDIGAHVGYYTLLAARRVGPGGRVIAFEPNPDNFWFLKRHVALNNCSNVTVEPLAAADEARVQGFSFGTGSGTGRLAAAGDIQVETVSVNAYVERHGLSVTHMKIDVEGGEVAVLRGASRVLDKDRPIIFLSTHGPQLFEECLALLKEHRYAFSPLVGQVLADSPDVLCTPTERAS